MKRLLIMASIAALLMPAVPSYAQQGGGGGRRAMDRPTRQGPPPQQQQQQQMPPRDFRNDAQDPRRGQLSPEERRQLRRDIGDHGRDVYRDRQPPQR